MQQMEKYAFASDNTAGVDVRILAAMQECNAGTSAAYGEDESSKEINSIYSEVFEKEAFVFITPTGTSANGLALAGISPSYGAIFCHQDAHIVNSECGAPEFYTTGARLVLLPGENFKISSDTLMDGLAPYRGRDLHALQPSALSVTQVTDGGTVYDLAELMTLSEIAHAAGLRVHMDGSRIANALAYLGCSPADITWKAGVDILSFGATKNGTMNADAVICFDSDLAERLRYLHKRAGLLQSKMRFAAAQLRAYVSNNLWLENARKANANAQRLVAILNNCPGAALQGEVQGNQLFVSLDRPTQEKLADAGVKVRIWSEGDIGVFRLVAAYNESDELMSRFEEALS